MSVPQFHAAQKPADRKRRWIKPAAIAAIAFILGFAAGGGKEAEPVAQDSAAPTLEAKVDDLEKKNDELANQLNDAQGMVSQLEAEKSASAAAPPPTVEAAAAPTPEPAPAPAPATTQTPAPAPTTEAPAPAPEPAPTAAPEPQSASAYYANCDEAKAAGAAPLQAGDPGYRAGLDRDGDGTACEN